MAKVLFSLSPEDRGKRTRRIRRSPDSVDSTTWDQRGLKTLFGIGCEDTTCVLEKTFKHAQAHEFIKLNTTNNKALEDFFAEEHARSTRSSTAAKRPSRRATARHPRTGREA